MYPENIPLFRLLLRVTIQCWKQDNETNLIIRSRQQKNIMQKDSYYYVDTT